MVLLLLLYEYNCLKVMCSNVLKTQINPKKIPSKLIKIYEPVLNAKNYGLSVENVQIWQAN